MGNDSLTIQYYDAFSNLVKYINAIYNQTKHTGQQFEGYLVDINSYNKLLEIVYGLKGYSPQTQRFDLYNNETENKQLYKLETTNENNIIMLIEHNQSFIIVNKEFYDVVCEKKDENKITYIITPEKIILYLKNGTTKEFKNNKNNIIDKSSFLTETYNINEYTIMNSSQKYQEYKERNFVNNYEKYQGANRTILHNSLFNLSNQYGNQQHIQKINYNSSERLKILALLAVSQFYSIKENKLRKVFLINPEWLEYYKYSEIKKIVNEIYQKFPDSTQFGMELMN